MKKVHLTHGDTRLDLSEQEAVSLFSTLSQALDEAGIDPLKHATLNPSGSTQNFKQSSLSAPVETDC